MKSKAWGRVVKFDGLTSGVVLDTGYSSLYDLEQYVRCWLPHTDDTIWEPYTTPTHPLLNSDSSHYRMTGGVEAIELMEAMFTREELMAWAKLTAMKYRLRIGDKDSPEKEIKKIKTYEAYYKYLEELK